MAIFYPHSPERQGRLRRPRYPSPPWTAGLVAHRVSESKGKGVILRIPQSTAAECR
ncbi:hypothetical protein ebA2536 [Aromatoleum aromaticum EbN1]|uniref:Uncharacterized protein n=1 Tax=Aromatoleum aromaticum (strain DSM 19018 / LMG 30748 / EbN1) TaxID=76114 RepID=Q5P556_AROAE|nr:hypothetical protein ebA2536 [Aromatoleum aromaticum EbN1]